MLDSAVRLRSQVRQFTNRRKPTATRYSAAFRAEVVSVARARVAEGVPVAGIARELGLRTQTLTLWLRGTLAPKLRAVRVERDPRPAPVVSEFRPVVVTPSGVRIEGLDFETLLRVVRSLA
jgi:transposase-like protein